jgi:hypothetical protein
VITIPITGVIKTFSEGIYIFYLHDAGVAIYTEAGLHGSVTLAGITCGDSSSAGLYLGTNSGVYELTTANIVTGGDQTANTTLFKASPDLLSNTVSEVAARDTKVAVASAGGVDLFYAGATRYSFTYANGCGNVTFDDTNLFFTLDDTSLAYYIAYPVANWVIGDTLQLYFDPPGDSLFPEDRRWTSDQYPPSTVNDICAIGDFSIGYMSGPSQFIVHEVDEVNKEVFLRAIIDTTVPIIDLLQLSSNYFVSANSSAPYITLWYFNTVTYTITQYGSYTLPATVKDMDYSSSGQIVVSVNAAPWLYVLSRSGTSLVSSGYTLPTVTSARYVSMCFASSGVKLFLSHPSGPGGVRVYAYRLSGNTFVAMTVPSSIYIQTVTNVRAYSNRVIVMGSSTTTNGTCCEVYSIGTTSLTDVGSMSGLVVDTSTNYNLVLSKRSYSGMTPPNYGVHTSTQPSSSNTVNWRASSNGSTWGNSAMPVTGMTRAAFGNNFCAIAYASPGIQFYGINDSGGVFRITDPLSLQRTTSFITATSALDYAICMTDNFGYDKCWLFTIAGGVPVNVGAGGPSNTTAALYAWTTGTLMNAWSGSSQTLILRLNPSTGVSLDVAAPYCRDIALFGDYFCAYIPTSGALLGGYDVNGTSGTKQTDIPLLGNPLEMRQISDADYVVILCTGYLVLAERTGTSMTVHHEMALPDQPAGVTWDTLAGYIVLSYANPTKPLEFYTVVADVITPAIVTGVAGLDKGAGICQWYGSYLMVAGPASTPPVVFLLSGSSLIQVRPATAASGTITGILGINNTFVVITSSFPFHHTYDLGTFVGDPVENVVKLEADVNLLVSDDTGISRFSSLPVSPYTDPGWEPAINERVIDDVAGATLLMECNGADEEFSMVGYSAPTESGLYSRSKNRKIFTEPSSKPVWVSDDGVVVSVDNLLGEFPTNVVVANKTRVFIDAPGHVWAYQGPLYQIAELVWFLTTQTATADMAVRRASQDGDILTTEYWDIAGRRTWTSYVDSLNTSLIGVDSVYTKKLGLTGTVLKIFPYEADDLIVYVTTTGIYGVTLSTKTILSSATVSATCACADETVIYYGTTAGVYSITLADMLIAGDRSAQVILEANTASGTPLLNNNVLDIDIFLNKFIVVSSGGCDFFDDWAGRTKKTYALGTITKCGMGQYWFALCVADTIYTWWFATLGATFTTANATPHTELTSLSYTTIHQIEFEDGLFFSTNKGVYIFNLDATIVKFPPSEDVNAVAFYPAPMANVSGGGLVLGIKDAVTGEGRVEVVDIGA